MSPPAVWHMGELLLAEATDYSEWPLATCLQLLIMDWDV